ncbi:hypothetical protein B0H67DRAFT_595564 [Lasiosphaeris hirsuta]|uniref:Uncharacterized protein n=1 Tax=Lasiosphaeris hirsuta TaxID=260670 RepID=A0AA39ZRJ7_9PEZI|nr:hypothetical protein B0H67DRAFT_595564 [Lasiosphaeris hirsuta]
MTISTVSLRKITLTIGILLSLALLFQLTYHTWYLGLPAPASTVHPTQITETLVVAAAPTDDISWLAGHFPVRNVVSYRSSKGNEALAYLEYIVESYHDLPDIVIFIHNHDHAWHNARLFDFNMTRMLAHLDRKFVKDIGYFNLRCDWAPGCPARLRLRGSATSGAAAANSTGRTIGNVDGSEEESREETVMKAVWGELHPGHPIPSTLAQPCCSQFVASRESIRAVPRQRWLHFRSWVLETPLSNWFAGRVWEYTWQFVLAGDGVTTWCPLEKDCYCFGYGACFEGEDEWENWKEAEEKAQAMRNDYITTISGGDDGSKLKKELGTAEQELQGMVKDSLRRGENERSSRDSTRFEISHMP